MENALTNSVQVPATPQDCLNLIGGQWKEGEGANFQIHSPYNGKLIGRGSGISTAQLNDLVTASARAQADWGATPIKERTQIMYRFREVLMRDLVKISHIISSESGKTLTEAQAGLLKGVEVLEFALSLQNMDHGGRMEVSRGVYCEYRREPVGVVAGITPFNFPAMVPLWMLPIAITLGNSFVWKPSDKTPLTPYFISEAFREAGLPPGVLSIANGGKDVVEAILDHLGISAVGFVGSTPVARAVYHRGSLADKRVLALGGAKNHIILMPDADVEMASRGITDSFTGCAGQRCMAASVVVAVGPVDHILKQVIEKSQSIRVGQDMGAIINRESKNKISSAIDKAAKEFKLVADGRDAQVPSQWEGGNWLAPSVIDQVKPGSGPAIEELFGPVLSVIRVNSLSEALTIDKSSTYGNATSVFTSSGAVAERVSREAHAGMVGINIGVPVPREPFSFGGFYESKFGHGDITGPSSLDFWSSLKKVTTKWALQKDHNWMG